MRRKKKTNYIPIFILVFIFTMSIGYSIFSETLNINGSVTANYVISGNQLDLLLTQTSGRYSSGTTPANFTYLNETLVGNTLTINYQRKSTSGTYYTFALTVPYKNRYPYTLTTRTLTTAINSGSTNVNSRSITTVPTGNIAAQGTGTATLNLRVRTSSTQVIKVTYTLRYTVNGVIQYFYFVINIT